MKSVKRISNILKRTGIVLVILSLVMWFYLLTTGGAARNGMTAMLRASGVEMNALDSVMVDRVNYTAMADIVQDKTLGTQTRANAVKPYYADFAARAAEGEKRLRSQAAQAVIARYENEFDYAAFLERYAEMGDQSGNRELSEAIEYLDSFTKPSGKKGKLAKLLEASCAEQLETMYADLCAEHGEEVGTYQEFVLTVQAMVKLYTEAGNEIASTKDYLNGTFTYEDYLAQLPEIIRREKAESSANLLDEFAALAEQKQAGEAADVAGFFHSAYELLAARYTDGSLPEEVMVTEVLGGLLNSASFDGSLSSVMSAVRTRQTELKESSFEAKLDSFCTTLVSNADSQAPVSGFSVLWRIVAQYPFILVAGIVLLILSKVLAVVLARYLLARRESAGIQEEDDVLLRVEHLKQYFRSGDYVNRAVDDVSFAIKKGEVFGLVGESGCGKTTTGRTIINLYDPTEGDVYFQGLRISSTQNGAPVLIRELRNEQKAAIAKMKEALQEQVKQQPEKKAELEQAYKDKVSEMKAALRKRIDEVRENALESSVEKSKCIEMYREKRKAELTQAYEADCQKLTGEALAERKAKYDIEMKVAAKDNIMTRMQMIFQDPIASINPRMTVREIISEGLVIRGVKDKKYIDQKVNEMLELVGLVPEHADRYPHEFSGGQRQRIGIARAIVMEPDLIIADEPISALDVSIQAQVINLLNDLRNKMGLTILFIAHNLSVVKYFSDRIAVMYYGKIMELATSDELFEHPLHPYTKSLLSAIPYPDPHYEKQRVRIEYVPARAHDYSVDKPSLREIKPGHFIHCNDAEFEKYKKELGL